ncbi:MAG TPA: PASTA domain-containing protein, partial [Thermoleophilaceae bacterium]
LTGNVGFGTMSTTCPVGSPGTPVNVHMTTAKGSPWDAATGAFSMVDNTAVLSTIHCSNGLLDPLLTVVLGSTTNPGDNVVNMIGSALRRPDPVVPTVTNPTTSTTTTTTTGSGATGGGTTAEIAPGSGNQPAAPVVKRCVVPKLIGKTLKQAKRALKKAGCKPGKSKKTNSKKRKKGRIVKQRYKVGTKLPAGAKVPLTVSKGPKNARKHRSR